MTTKYNNKKFAQQFLLISLLLSGAMIFYSMRIFLGAFLGAVILYVLFRPAMRKFYIEKKWNKNLCALLICLFTFLIIMTPILVSSYMIIPKITLFFNEGSVTMKVLSDLDNRIFNLTGYQFISTETLQNLKDEAGGYITQFLGASLAIISEIAMMYLFLFFFLINVGNTEAFLESHLPFASQKISDFSHELEVQTFSNALGSPLLALVQGLFAMFGYWIFGLPEPVFWGVMTGLFSFLPLVGSALIWLPASIFQFISGNIWQGIAILLYGVLIISVIDNVFRFIFQKKFADIHPLVTIIGVIVGLQLFGVSGIIFGPLLISYFLILLKIFQEEYLQE